MENQRAFERFDLIVPAKVGIERSGEEEHEISLVSSNICAGGAFFITEEPLPEGTRIRMDFTLSIEKLKKLLDSECRIKVKGEVVRSEEAGIAVRFHEDYQIIPVKRTLQ